MSGCYDFPMFRELTTPPFLTVISFGATKSPAHPNGGDRVSSQNVGKPLHPHGGLCLMRKFH
jgi:hypothetical protein